MTEATGTRSRSSRGGKGLKIERIYTTPGVHPYDEVTWESRDVVQTNWKTGEVIFEQRGVEFPDFWSVNASTIVTTKYFRGAVGTPEREKGLKQLVDRVVLTYARAGKEHGYFGTDEDAEIFEHELTYALVHQVFSFNSPVWFNVGTKSPQQVSACFILSVDDSMDSILNWYKEEGFIFKGGSGAGLNLSRIRSSKELLSSGGTASGPVSFMRGADASAGTIKSGGATRRAAKMVVLDVDHPDVEEFVMTKAREEDKIRALRDAGFDMDLGGADIVSVQYQNANNSVRVTDAFMRAVEDGTDFGLTSRMTGEVIETIDARDLWGKIAQAAWECADPGVQYDDTINDWHTNPETGRITASNPCFVADTLVAVADGRGAVRIANLVGTDVDVYSKDLAGRTVTRRMSKIRKTRESTEIVRVTLDDSSTVDCTSDHPFMLRDGSYVEAKDLKAGESLKRFDSEVAVERDALVDDLIAVNHKVLSVVPAGQADVYDGEVAETHNFAIVTNATNEALSGVYVHNCSEYMSLDNSSCNLASLNLLKFLRDDNTFDVEAYQAVVELVITAMDISICFADFPTESIGETTRDYRQLGIGYANLGALLMATGRGYDSEGGRALAASLTSLLTGAAYKRSAELAGIVGPYAGYARNADAHRRVMRKHQAANDELRPLHAMDSEIHKVATKAWDAVVKVGEKNGYRNAQASVLAPTGCLTGDTMVTTDRGLQRLSDLGDVWGERWQDLGVQVSTDEGAREANKFFVNGEEPTRRVVTEGGYRIQGTLAHRIKVVDPTTGQWTWKRMAEVGPGDLVPMQMGTLVGESRQVPLPVLDQAYYAGDRELSVPQQVDSELAELVGYFMGDGSLHAKGIRLCVADADTDVVERIGVLSKGLFNLAPRVSQQQGYQEVTLQSVRLARWWQAAGFAKDLHGVDHAGKGWTPRVPAAILETNSSAVYSAFLRGLFEADGTVLQGVPSVATSSQTFAGDIRTVLLALGYPTTTRQTQSGWGGMSQVVRLRNINHAQGFGTQIGFMGGRKASLVADHPSKQAGDVEVENGPGYIFETVAANEDGGVQPTYDLSIPSNVTYVAAGFVSHNTIGFMMDCDTTGIEPDFSLVKFKKLVGGGSMQIVNQTIPRALDMLGYTEETIEAIVEYIAEKGHVIDAPGLKPEHYEVFDCAMGARAIKPMGHVRMMAAAQPFLSGAISKTVNLPESATVEEIADVYMQGWKLGLKALACYRDSCKVGQPLSDGKKDEEKEDEAPAVEKVVEYRPVRRRLPKRRSSQTTSFAVGGAEGYLTASSYPDDGLGEIFLKFGKQGSTLAGLMDAFSLAVSVALQYGVPLETYVEKFTNLRFEPAGMTDDPDVRMAQSIMDYVFRRLALDFLDFETRSFMGIHTAEERARQLETGSYVAEPTGSEDNDLGEELESYSQSPAPASRRQEKVEEAEVKSSSGAASARAAEPGVHSSAELLEQFQGKVADAPICMTCGTKMRPAGSCYVCEGCGSTSGCS